MTDNTLSKGHFTGRRALIVVALLSTFLAAGCANDQGFMSVFRSDPPNGAAYISAGSVHSCAVLHDGTAHCWGSNGRGQLGDGTHTDSLLPVQVRGLTGVTAIAVGIGAHTTDTAVHTCAVVEDGTAYCWGNNDYGQLGNGATDTFSTDSPVPVQVQGLVDVTAITAGEHHTCAVLRDGTAHCWGRFDGTQTLSSVPVQVQGLTDATAISTSNANTCGLLQDGTVHCWGSNNHGQLGGNHSLMGTKSAVPVQVPGLTDATAISVGGSGHICALVQDGNVHCWGRDDASQLGVFTRVDSPERPANSPELVQELADVTAISAGSFHTCALLQDATARCWGDYTYSQQGEGFSRRSPESELVQGLTDISAGMTHSCAIVQHGTAKCWGNNRHGQLGDGTANSSETPVQVILPGVPDDQ